MHWGYDREKYPLPSQRKLAHNLIDCGANLILGHHPHVLQGIENYNKGVIVYSQGNFIFPDISYKQYNLIQKRENKESIIFQIRFSKAGIESYNLTPIRVNEDYQPLILEDEEKEALLKKIEILSEGFSSGNYRRYWRKNRVRKDLLDIENSGLYNVLAQTPL